MNANRKAIMQIPNYALYQYKTDTISCFIEIKYPASEVLSTTYQYSPSQPRITKSQKAFKKFIGQSVTKLDDWLEYKNINYKSTLIKTY